MALKHLASAPCKLIFRATSRKSLSFRLSVRPLTLLKAAIFTAWQHPQDNPASLARNFAHDGTAHTPPSTEILSELTETEFEDVCEETLESLGEIFEDLGDSGKMHQDFDVQLASGVLTVQLGPDLGTYVINKQTPNKQIWLSSPKSGPKRYDFMDGRWIYKHDGVCLHDLLTTEISETLNTDMDFTTCSYGKMDNTQNR